MPVYRVMFEATPTLSHPSTEEVGGAFIVGWVSAESASDAVAEAVRFHRESGWILDEPDEVIEMTPQALADWGEEAARFVTEAKRDGPCYTRHPYAVVDEEDD